MNRKIAECEHKHDGDEHFCRLDARPQLDLDVGVHGELAGAAAAAARASATAVACNENIKIHYGGCVMRNTILDKGRAENAQCMSAQYKLRNKILQTKNEKNNEKLNF